MVYFNQNTNVFIYVTILFIFIFAYHPFNHFFLDVNKPRSCFIEAHVLLSTIPKLRKQHTILLAVFHMFINYGRRDY